MPYIGAGIQKFNTADNLTVTGTSELKNNVTVTGDVTASGTVLPTGDTAAGDAAALGFTSTEGLILTGQGSTSDVVIKNDADTTVCFVPTGTDDLKFNDTARIIMGAGDDLQIIHDGSNSIVSDNGTGNLVLRSDAAAVEIDFNTDETAALFNHNGSVELYHDNSKKFETTSDGATVTNSIQFGSDAQTKVAGAGSSDVDLLVSGDTNIRFETGTNERMRIDNSGNVGIGTTSPNVELEIAGAGEMLRLQSSDTNKASIRAIQSGGGDRWILGTLDSNDSVTLQASNSTGELIFETGGATERARISSGGRMSIGTTSTSFRFNVVSDQSDYVAQFDRNVDIDGNFRNHIKFSRGGTAVGEIKTSQSATQYGTSSDHRLKENVEGMTGAIARVKQLSPKRFSWIVDELDSPNFDGFLAHEAQTVVPQAVSGTHNNVDEDGNPVMQGIDHSHLVPLLTGALQEAIAEIETLKTKVAALEGE